MSDKSPPQSTNLQSPIPKKVGMSLLIITILSTFLHFYKLNQLPPGLWFDEAWSAVAARDTAVSGIYPVYYAANFGGMHPAIVYLTRFANLFSNGHPLTIRYALASVGTLSTVLAFFAFRAVFKLEIGDVALSLSKGRRLKICQPNILALLAALILTITFPFLLFTRMGFESSLVTPASLILFWVFAIALQKNKSGWYILTGLMLGLTIYSFDTARFLPFAITIAYWGIVLIYRRNESLKSHFFHFLALTVAAIIIFIPLGNYYLRNWDQFTARAGITTYNTLGAGAESVPLAILKNAWQTIGGLILPNFGDVIARHNLPGRPVYDPFLAILLILGLITLIRFWKRPSAIILISWAGVMLIPVILTDGAPTYTRIFGAIPALAGIVALSFETILRITYYVLRNSFTEYAIRNITTTIIGLTLFLSLLTTTRDYFNKWATLPQLFDDFQVADWETAVFAQEQLATNTVYLTPNQIDEAHPTFDLVLRNSDIRTFPADCLVVQENANKNAFYIIKNSQNPDVMTQLKDLYPQGDLAQEFISPLTGEKLYSVFNTRSLTSNNQQRTENKEQNTAQFGDSIALIAQPSVANLQSFDMLRTGSPISIPLTWQAINTLTQDHTYFIHLYRTGAEDEPPVAQLDQQPCLPTSQWHKGEVIFDTAVITLPPNLPSGEYTLGLGWYTWPSFERLSVKQTENTLSDQRLLLGKITITEFTPLQE